MDKKEQLTSILKATTEMQSYFSKKRMKPALGFRPSDRSFSNWISVWMRRGAHAVCMP